MGIYLTCFFMSYILCLYGEKLIQKRKNMYIAKLLLFLSVLLIAIIAGLRDNCVGTDTYAYTAYYIEYGSRFHTLKDFMSFFAVYEPGFNVFSYVIGILFHHSSHWFLFWCALVIYGFTMKTLFYYRNNCSISMVWLFFLMLNCTEALNITRHYMALAMASYAFCYVFEKDNKKFILFSLLAMSFHVSAIFNIFLFLIYKGLHRFNTRWYKVMVVVGTVILSAFYSLALQFLSRFSFIGLKAEQFLGLANYEFQLNPILIRLPFLLLLLLHYKSFISAHLLRDKEEVDTDDVFGEFCFLIVIIELILSQLRGFSVTLYRLTGYIAIMKYISYSRVLNIPKRFLNRSLLYVFSYVYMIIVFIYWGVVLESGNIVPYVSEILGIK